jgi:S-adenosylmethionine hydrolase
VRIITLLSDFGSASPYPAEMKAVLHARCRATVVDITHDIPAHDALHGAHVLAAAARYFPAGTVHLAVVDPGVGTSRLPLAIAAGGQSLVGPDNGLLMVAARMLGEPRAFAIDVDRFASRPLSSTFHGRDLFAPVAAVLASGLPVNVVGAPVGAPVELPEATPQRSPGILRGQVLYRDPFGNLITNIPGPWLCDLADPLTLASGRRRAVARRVGTYGDSAAGTLVVLEGSNGTVEIAVSTGSAAARLGIEIGDRVTLRAQPSRRPRSRDQA